MEQYLSILEDVLKCGEIKENRTGVDCLTLVNQEFRHDMSDGFPVLTTKRMPVKSVAAELECFIKGLTCRLEFQKRNCFFWENWKNPLSTNANDLGPIYGYQARRFNHPYANGCPNSTAFKPLYNNPIDQLAYAVHQLKTNPNNRRLVISHWNPLQQDQMALPACHYTYAFQQVNGKLSLHWTQRSCDMFLGVPCNIMSYGLLLSLVAKHVNMEPHILSGSFLDTHIYINHKEQVEEQLSRFQYNLPTLKLPKEVDIFKWSYKDFELEDYSHAPSIKASIAV